MDLHPHSPKSDRLGLGPQSGEGVDCTCIGGKDPEFRVFPACGTIVFMFPHSSDSLSGWAYMFSEVSFIRPFVACWKAVHWIEADHEWSFSVDCYLWCVRLMSFVMGLIVPADAGSIKGAF